MWHVDKRLPIFFVVPCKTPNDSVTRRKTFLHEQIKVLHKNTESPSESLISDYSLNILRTNSVFGEVQLIF